MAIVSTSNSSAIGSYNSVQAEATDKARARKARNAQPAGTGGVDVVTLSAQVQQTQSQTGTQISQAREAANTGEDHRNRSREPIATGSKSVSQAINAYLQTSRA